MLTRCCTKHSSETSENSFSNHSPVFTIHTPTLIWTNSDCVFIDSVLSILEYHRHKAPLSVCSHYACLLCWVMGATRPPRSAEVVVCGRPVASTAPAVLPTSTAVTPCLRGCVCTSGERAPHLGSAPCWPPAGGPQTNVPYGERRNLCPRRGGLSV